MSNPLTLIAVFLASLSLFGCAKESPTQTVATTEAASSEMAGAARMPPGDTSVPSASSVFPPETEAPRPDETAGRAVEKMTRKEESAAMPMVGQNNDHSAPVAPAKGVSAP